MRSRRSWVVAQLVRAIALRMKLYQTCPITPVHIPGKENAMTDIPSCSFGSVGEWHCKTDNDLLTLFNSRFPLRNQELWALFCLTSRIFMRVISMLPMRDTLLEEWPRLQKIGSHIGTITFGNGRVEYITTECDTIQILLHKCNKDIMGGERACRLHQSLAQIQPLARQSPWPATATQPN